MAKKKKNKSDTTDTSAKADKSAGSDKSGSDKSSSASVPGATVPTTPAEIAFARGNFAAVHHLAKAGDESAKKLLPLTTVDMGQVACGIVALAVVLTIAIFTLTH